MANDHYCSLGWSLPGLEPLLLRKTAQALSLLGTILNPRERRCFWMDFFAICCVVDIA